MNGTSTTYSIQKIANLSFFLYLLVIFFRTSLPFQPPASEIDEKAVSNIVNQIVYSSLFLASLPAVWIHRKEAFRLFVKERYLALFLIWCAISICWSNFPFISFKRLFQIIATVVICLGALLPRDSSQELFPFLKAVLYLYVPLSLLSVVIVPGAIDPKTLTWRGLAPSKNHLGQVSLISIIYWTIHIKLNKNHSRLVPFLMLMGSAILLIGSRSMTSIITVLFLGTLLVLLFLDKCFQQLRIGHFFFVFASFSLLGCILYVFSFFPETVGHLLTFMGKDETFTGRTDLWAAVFREARLNLIFGSGFGGFWVIINPRVLDIYEDFVWLPNHAHFGYLDILNETGIIGLGIFSIMVFYYFVNSFRFPGSNLWKWFVIAVLAINFQESTLFRQNVITGVMFIISYLALYHDYIRWEESDSDDRDRKTISTA